jgi:hypothetical protein
MLREAARHRGRALWERRASPGNHDCHCWIFWRLTTALRLKMQPRDAGEYAVFRAARRCRKASRNHGNYFYMPDMRQPPSIQESVINKTKWDELPPDLKAIVKQALLAEIMRRLDNDSIERKAATDIVEKHNVKLMGRPTMFRKRSSRPRTKNSGRKRRRLHSSPRCSHPGTSLPSASCRTPRACGRRSRRWCALLGEVGELIRWRALAAAVAQTENYCLPALPASPAPGFPFSSGPS